MTGPAVSVFDGVLNPELLPQSAPEQRSQGQPSPEQHSEEQPFQQQTTSATTGETKTPTTTLDCANDCKDECQQPKQCLRDEAQARVQEFLSSTSLDAMINLAGDSLEERTLSRLNRDDKP